MCGCGTVDVHPAGQDLWMDAPGKALITHVCELSSSWTSSRSAPGPGLGHQWREDVLPVSGQMSGRRRSPQYKDRPGSSKRSLLASAAAGGSNRMLWKVIM